MRTLLCISKLRGSRTMAQATPAALVAGMVMGLSGCAHLTKGPE
jgi:hypothetical protein